MRFTLTTIICLSAAMFFGLFLYRSKNSEQISGFESGCLSTLQTTLHEGAIELFSKALQRFPENVCARIGLAQAYQKKGWHTQALQEYELAAKKLNELSFQTYVQLGELAEKLNNKTEAQRYYKSAQTFDSRSQTVLDRLKNLR